MKELKLKVSNDDVNAIFSKYDTDGGNTLDYGEFLKLLSFKSKAINRESKEKSDRLDILIDKIRQRLEDNLGSEAQSRKRIKEVFEEIDRDGSSSIDKRELRKAMEILDLKLRPADIDALFDRFDSSGDGHIDYGEFLKLLGFGSKIPSKPSKPPSSSTRSRLR